MQDIKDKEKILAYLNNRLKRNNINQEDIDFIINYYFDKTGNKVELNEVLRCLHNIRAPQLLPQRILDACEFYEVTIISYGGTVVGYC